MKAIKETDLMRILGIPITNYFKNNWMKGKTYDPTGEINKYYSHDVREFVSKLFFIFEIRKEINEKIKEVEVDV